DEEAANAWKSLGIKKIKFAPGIVLLDTPGVLPKKESKQDSESMIKHAKIGIKNYDKIKDPEFVVYNLMKENPNLVESSYNMESNSDPDDFLEKLGRKKHFLRKGNQIDIDRTAKLIIKDWQTGNIKHK
ncbi:MAG: hypothetical protein AABY22_35460, partial [Nanoarchaeota archaeon]